MKVGNYSLVAVKRPRIPEWVWASCAFFHLCQIQPFRWILTDDSARAIRQAIERDGWHAEEK